MQPSTSSSNNLTSEAAANDSGTGVEELSDEDKELNCIEEIEAIDGPGPAGYRCAAHTMQLAVMDALKHADTATILASARALATQLRHPSIMMCIRQMKIKKPKIDCPTRWSSSCDMISRLIELRSFCEQMAAADENLIRSDDEWQQYSNVLSALLPAKFATNIFQKEQLTAGDFYGAWMKCKAEVAALALTFGDRLVSCMEMRERTLFDNDLFRSAIFLDPRY